MILQIKKLAIIEDGSPANVVNLVPVTEGPEGAAVFGLSNEHENFFIEDRQTYVDRGNPTLEIAVLKPDSSDITQIQSWVNNQTDVYISAVTVDGGYLFGDRESTGTAVKLVANEQLSDNDLYSVSVQRQTTPGFSPDTGLHQNGFWAGENLLGGYVWGDADSDGTANGWVNFAINTLSFSSGVQTLTTDDEEDQFQRRIFYPFEGQEITFSLTANSVGANVDIFSIGIYAFDASPSEIDNSVTIISTTGRKSVSHTLPSSTVGVICRVILKATAGNSATVDISDPSLRIGTGTTYTKY